MGLCKLAVVAVALCIPMTLSAKSEKPTSGSLGQQLDAIVERGIENKVFPGAVLIVGQPGKVLYSKTYGNLTYDTVTLPMKMDTIFDLASCSKVVGTATAAMVLYDQHKISLDDLVSKYIPDFGTGGKENDTLRDLMTHVSGLKAYESSANAEKIRKPGDTTADAMIRLIASLKASYPPRSKVTYSCLNMQTEARVNETVLGGRMDDFLVKNVYGPLGMKDTRYKLTAEQKARCAPTQRKKDGTPIVGETHDPIANYHSAEDHCPGNAGLFSTGPDLAKFCEMYLRQGRVGNRQILSEATVTTMTAVQTPPGINDERAIGWDVYTTAPYCTKLNKKDGSRIIGHTGYTGTMILLDQLSKTYMVFLTNRTWPDDSDASGKGTTAARKAIWDAILRSRPEYRAIYATKSGD